MKTVTKDNFEAEVLKSAKPVLVDFYADWCGPCKALSPILKQLAAEMAGTLEIVKVDVDASPELAQEYAVRAMPTLMLFRGGDLIARKTGGGAKSHMAQWINESLALPAGHVVDYKPKAVTLTPDQRKTLTEEFMKALDAQPGFANSPAPALAATQGTQRQYYEEAIRNGEYFKYIEKMIGEGLVTFEGYIELLHEQQKGPSPKP